MPRTRLESWKAIAVHLHREINTVQRWERNESLPVHRHVHGKGGSVYAFADEIDEWLRRRSIGGDRRTEGALDPQGPEAPAPEGETPPAADAAQATPHHSTPAMHRPWLLAIALALVGVAGALTWWTVSMRPDASSGRAIRSVAVLPLRDLSPRAGEEYFADSMTEALIARLATTTDLKVTSRTSAMVLKEREAPLPEIARSLGVDAVLEGSVTHVGDRLRIIATLVDADADTQLWSGKFERPFEDVLTVQGEIADAVARAVRATVQGTVQHPGANREVSSESYLHYLKGKFLLSTNSAASIQQAMREFEAALAVDPTFAPAYAGLASAYQDMNNRIIGAPVGDGSSERSAEAALRAIDLAPDLAEAHAALGRARMAQLKWDEAESALRRALSLNPSDASTQIWLGQWLVIHGQREEGVLAARRAIALDPLSPRTMVAAAFLLGIANADDEQRAYLRAALAIRPDYFQAQYMLGLSLSGSRESLPEAIDLLERAVGASGRSPQILCGLAMAYARAGRVREATRLADEVIGRQQTQSASPLAIAVAHMVKGEREHALEALELGLTQRSRGIHQLPVTDWFQELRDEPRFRDLIRRVLAG